MKKIILITLLPITIIMAGSFIMTKGNPLTRPEASTLPSTPPIIPEVYATEVTVNSIVELEDAVANADVTTKIFVENGTYNSRDIVLRNNNAKVFIVAQNHNNVIFQRKISIRGDNITISGMKFNGGRESSNTGGMIEVFGNDAHITRCTWDDSQARKWLVTNYSAFRTEISYCLFQNKNNNKLGTGQRPRQTVQLNFDYQDLTPHNHHVHHNHWKNIPIGKFPNSYEALQVYTIEDGKIASVGGAQQNTIVAFNLFEDVNGEGEIISVKSNKCIIKYNTFRNNNGAVTFRFGNNSKFFGNSMFSGNSGVVFNGENHKIYNNYIENMSQTGIMLRDGDDFWAGYITGKNIEIKNNIVINCNKGNIRFGAAKHPRATKQHPPEDTIVSNNILLQESADYLLNIGRHTSKPISGITFEKNTFQGTLDRRLSNGFIDRNPQLTKHTNGLRTSGTGNLMNISVMTAETTGPNAK